MDNRITGIDLSRSFAILGMIFVNYNIVLNSSKSGIWVLTKLFSVLEGKAASLFVVLAGVGISLTTKNNAVEARKLLLKRSLFLFILGLLYTPIWPADILHFYGVYIFIVSFFLTIESRNLIKLAVIPVIIFLYLVIIIDYEEGWDFETLTYTDFWTIEGLFRHIFYNGFHPVFPWISFVFIGMWLGRKNFRDAEVRKVIFLQGAFMVVSSSFLSWLITRNSDDIDVKYLFGTQPLPPFPLFVIIGIGGAFITIVVCIELTNRYGNTLIMKALVSTGQLSLTNYVAHVIIGMGIMDVFGLLNGRENPTLFSFIYSIIMFVVLVIFSYNWRKRYKRGPLESIMRKVT